MRGVRSLTIKSRIALATTLVFGIALIVFAAIIYHTVKRAELEALEARLESHAEKIQTEIEEQVAGGVFPDITDLDAISTEGLPRVWRQLIDLSGKVLLADSLFSRTHFAADGGVSPQKPEFDRIQLGERSYLEYRVPVEVEERNRYVLFLAVPLRDLDKSLVGLRWIFLLTIPVVLILSALAVHLITRKAFGPLSTMTVMAQRISATDLSQRLNLPGTRDEVRDFAETFNSMLERIEAAFASHRQFVADASHELRTPLTVIIAELEFALQRISDPEARKNAEISLVEADRLSRLVEGLLLLARTDASQNATGATTFRADELVVDVVHSLRRQAELKQIQVTPYIQEAVELQGQGEMIRRALFNVLENAIKYSPSNSDISIELEESDSAVAITTRDQGPGISESDQRRVFERFFRGENARAETDGSGLGLAIAKKLIELNGGSITLYSSLGAGTSVLITLPRRASK